MPADDVGHEPARGKSPAPRPYQLDVVEPNDPLIWKGRKASELSHAEAVEALRHFFNAHIESFAGACAAERRMRCLEEVFTPEQIQQIDHWLSEHNDAMADAKKGDGSPLYRRWWQGDDEQQGRGNEQVY
jgi:hypothetical protein